VPLSLEEERLIYNNADKARALIREKLPKVMPFRSSSGFMDVAVLKSFAHEVRNYN
jgi:hypothetical protein